MSVWHPRARTAQLQNRNYVLLAVITIKYRYSAVFYSSRRLYNTILYAKIRIFEFPYYTIRGYRALTLGWVWARYGSRMGFSLTISLIPLPPLSSSVSLLPE